MPAFRFIGAAYQAASITQDDQSCINWYPEQDPEDIPRNPWNPQYQGDRGVITLYPTPGLTSKLQLPTSGPVRGMHVLPGGTILVVAVGAWLYQVNLSYNVTLIGQLKTSTGPVSLTDNGVSVYLADGPNRYYWTWGTNTFALVTDGAFTGANLVGVVDNYIIYNDPNSDQWGCTDVNSVTSSAQNFAPLLTAPGNLVALIANQRQVYLLGEVATEVWTDAGTYPFPFQAVQGAVMQHGCAAIGSVARLGESFAFLAQDTRGQAVVVMMNGYAPMRISTHAIEAAIMSYGEISDAVAFTYQQRGHEFYMLTFPSGDVTWCFDLATQLWHQRASMDQRGVLHRHRANSCAVFGGEVIVGDYENGHLYAMDPTNYTDNGALIPCIRRARHITDNLKRGFFHTLQLQFQPGVGVAVGQGSNPQAMLRYSDDGGFTWSREHWCSLGKQGAYKNRAIWRRLGFARDRIFEVRVTDPVFRVLVSANLSAEGGVH
jgi:hypothetical protein